MFACKDVSVVRGRGDSDVVRPVVAPVVPGTHQGCVGDAGKGIPGSGMPGGGEERCSSSSSHKTKPNQVGGGLHRRIQLWEQKTGQKGTIIQGKIGTEANTDGDPRGIFHGRHRKQKTDNN